MLYQAITPLDFYRLLQLQEEPRPEWSRQGWNRLRKAKATVNLADVQTKINKLEGFFFSPKIPSR